MSTPRETRLLRAADAASLRRAIAGLVGACSPAEAAEAFVLVPTRAAAEQLRRTLEDLLLDGSRPALALPAIGSRADLYDALHQRLTDPPRRLSAFEREVMLSAAAGEADRGGTPTPFTLRPGLVAEMMLLYDALRRQLRTVARFEEYLAGELEQDVDVDRGAVRMLQQTRFLAATFRGYERRVLESGAVDEHALRDWLIADPPARPLGRLIVTVLDRAADPQGLWHADFDVIARLPGLAHVDLLATEALLSAGYLERLHEHLPGLIDAYAPDAGWGRPVLQVPDAGTWVFTSRDREEELAGVARRLRAEHRAGRGRPLARTALVVRRPLPYLYLARDVLGDAGIPFETLDTLPLAAEPYAAALDLVFGCVTSGFTRASAIALLRSPHFAFEADGMPVPASAVTALDWALAEARYLGEAAHLEALSAEWSGVPGGSRRDARTRQAAAPAAVALVAIVRALTPLTSRRPVPDQIADLVTFLTAHAPRDSADAPTASRHRRVRAAVLAALEALAGAYARHDPEAAVTIADLAAAVRRWLEGQTFAPRTGEGGVQILDPASALYGEFDEVLVLGLVEGEWPERERRSIFYPASLLSNLQWPEEKSRLAAARAGFADLLHLARDRTTLSTITLEDDSIVEPSSLLEDVRGLGLPQVVASHDLSARIFSWEALVYPPLVPEATGPEAAAWATLRMTRTPAEAASFHGEAGAWAMPRVSVSRVERYLECPFRFFASEVLGLEAEPEDEDTRTPLERGRFLHELFERFYQAWAGRHQGQITPATLDDARGLFDTITEEALATLSPSEAALERPRLRGSAVGAGIAHRVFSMEAERPEAIVDRLLEFPFEGAFQLEAEAGGTRAVTLRGKADRIDLISDGTFRVIDYKSKKVPDPKKALQLPIYSVCATVALAGRRGRDWTLGEACYISFEGARTVVPLTTRPADLPARLTAAQGRMLGALDDIAAGHFPPAPDDRQLCAICAFGSVCRKDYVTAETAEAPAGAERGDE
ncbi:MAG: PD-(D/E)XK nuclease family protein [Vicinamibacterales bacterium]|nr:PD-(D/E)XK nuclease family protein [Vicinamibacterales bacterium]